MAKKFELFGQPIYADSIKVNEKNGINMNQKGTYLKFLNAT